MNEQTLNNNFIRETFEATVKKFPNRVALSDAISELTFTELQTKTSMVANKISRELAASKYLGYVPISTTRDVESSVIVLACILHDIPFAPIDPEWSEERLEFVYESLGKPEFILTSETNRTNLSAVVKDRMEVKTLTSLLSPEDLEKETNFVPVTSELGFVILTSGTTGFPKGVEFERGGLSKRLSQRQEKSSQIGQMRPEETSATLGQPINFAAGMFRLCDVLFGCSIRIISLDEMRVDVFVPLIRKLAINRLSVSPALLILLSDHTPKGLSAPYLPDVKEVTWGGDSISYSTVNGLKPYFFPETKMSGGFGATEATSSLGNSFLIKDAPNSGPMPIGRWEEVREGLLSPFEGMKDHYVVMAGEPMAKGYLNDPELTKQRFVIDEHGNKRWYSGDIVRVDRQGLIWHKGRVDDLVKIRGKLTSPSEATRALLQLEGVMDAVVLAVPGRSNDKKLVAHIALHTDSTLTSNQIRHSISKLLPAHLIPREFVFHPFIPKTQRGKPDRNALLTATPEISREESIEQPKTKSEKVLLEAVKTVLDVQKLSVTQNLWESGLDSLAALQLEAILSEDFSNISLDFISQHETIRALAKALDAQKSFTGVSEVVMNKDGKLPPIFAFPGAGNKAAHFTHFARELGSNQPVITLLFRLGDVSIENTTVEGRVQAALTKIEALSPGKVTIVGYSLGGAIAYEVARACASKGMRVSLIIFDTSLSLMTKVSSKGISRVRLANSKSKSGKLGLGLFVRLFIEGFKRYGVSKATKIAFVEKPFELLMARPWIRKNVRRLFSYWIPAKPSNIRIKVTETLIHNAVADLAAKPLTDQESHYIDLVYVHTTSNNQLEKWKEIASRTTFISTEGGHMSMLNPPHIAPLVDKLRKTVEIGLSK